MSHFTAFPEMMFISCFYCKPNILLLKLRYESGFDEWGFLTSGRVRVGFDQKVRVSGRVRVLAVLVVYWLNYKMNAIL